MILNCGNNTCCPEQEQGSKSSDWGGKQGGQGSSRLPVWANVEDIPQASHAVVQTPGQQALLSAEITTRELLLGF